MINGVLWKATGYDFRGQIITDIAASPLVSWISSSGGSQLSSCEDAEAALRKGPHVEKLRPPANSLTALAAIWVRPLGVDSPTAVKDANG